MTNWIEFETWMGDTSICGFLYKEDVEGEAPLQFYDANGFDCGSHIINTRVDTIEWEKLSQWFAEHDVVQDLMDFADEEKELLFTFEDDWGRIDKVELYINCSKKFD